MEETNKVQDWLENEYSNDLYSFKVESIEHTEEGPVFNILVIPKQAIRHITVNSGFIKE